MAEPIRHSLVTALRSVPDFAHLDDRTLLIIVGASANLFWPKGSVIFDPGAPSEALYVILSGEVVILDPQDGQMVEVSRIGPGHSFGELSVLLNTTHTKLARADGDTELMVVPADSFRELLASDPRLAEYFQRRIEERVPVRGEVAQST